MVVVCTAAYSHTIYAAIQIAWLWLWPCTVSVFRCKCTQENHFCGCGLRCIVLACALHAPRFGVAGLWPCAASLLCCIHVGSNPQVCRWHWRSFMHCILFIRIYTYWVQPRVGGQHLLTEQCCDPRHDTANCACSHNPCGASAAIRIVVMLVPQWGCKEIASLDAALQSDKFATEWP